MVGGGLPEGAGIVLQGPAGSEKVRFALAFLAEGLRTGGSGVLVIASQTAESTLSELRALGVDLDVVAKENRLRIVDWYSWSEEPVTDVEERGIILRSSVDLSSLGAALSRAIAALPSGTGKRAVIEMLSPALNVYELTQVYAFAQSSKRKFDRFGFTSFFLVEKDMHQAAVLSTLAQPFDGVIEIERTRTGDRIVRKIGVLHLRETTPSAAFLPLELTDKGFRVLSPAGQVPQAPGPPSPVPSPPGPSPGAVPAESKKLVRPPLTETESAAVRRTRDQLILEIAQERIKVDPTDKDAWFALAAGQATLQDIEGSLASLEKLAALDPRYPGLWHLKAKLHARLGQEEEWRQARMKADEYEEPSAGSSADVVPCPICAKPIAAEASLCPHCGSRTESEEDIIEELETLTKVTIQDLVEDTVKAPVPEPEAKPSPEEKAPAEAKPQPEVARKTEEEIAVDYERTLDELAELAASPAAPPPKTITRTPRGEARKGLTNGLILERAAARRASSGQGRTNGLTNGLRGRTNGLTNGLGRTNGLTNGLGRTNGLTNGLRGRTNGLTNGLRGRTNGLTNGLGRTNGLTNGLGRTNGLRKVSGMTRFQRRLGRSPWTRYGIPIAVIAVLIVPLFFLWGSPEPSHPIQIDGSFADWATQSLVDVPGGSSLSPNIRIVRIGVANNMDDLAFYVEVAGTILQGGGPSPGRMDTVRLFLDTDNSSATGYQIDGIGADRLLELSGYGGRVLASSLHEFDTNRNPMDWSGWIKGASIDAAASGSRLEVQAQWLDLRQGSADAVVAVHTQSWDGQEDAGDMLLSPSKGTMAIEQTPTLPQILSGSGVSLLSLTAKAVRQGSSFGSLDVHLFGTASSGVVSSLRLVDGSGNLVSQVSPAGREAVFQFPAQQIGASSSATYSVVGDFTGSGNGTFGVRIAAREGIGTTDSVPSLRTLPGVRSLGYVGSLPAGPQVDGAFAEWSAASADATGEPSTHGDPNVDLSQFGAARNGSTVFLYAEVTGRILAGSVQPVAPSTTPVTNTTPSPDTDRDTVPDASDPLPYDFNNDGVPDAQTNGDYDGDGVRDYGFSGGTDYWLNTTLPGSFPAPYAGRPVSVYIGPTERPPLLGEDTLRVYLDSDNTTGTGYSVGGIGADYLLEVTGKDGQIIRSDAMRFNGTVSGQWSWSRLGAAASAKDRSQLEASLSGVPVTNASRLYFEIRGWGENYDDSNAIGPSFYISSMGLPSLLGYGGPDPTGIADTSTASSATGGPSQRNVFYDGANFWAFYYDGSTIQYEPSADGLSWVNTKNTAFTTTGVQKVSTWFYDSGTQKIVYITGDSGAPDGTVIVRKGTISGTTITWGTEATVDVSTRNLAPKTSFIARDSTGYLWVVSNAADTVNSFNFAVARSTNTDDVSAWNAATSLLSAAISGNTIQGQILPLGSGEVYAVWYADGSIAGRKYSGTWGSVESIDSTTTSSSAKAPSAVVDASYNVHLVYIGISGTVLYRQRTTSWSAPTTLDSSSGNGYATLTRETGTGDLFAFWSASTAQIKGKRYSGSWSDLTLETNVNTKTGLTSVYNVTPAANVAWTWTQGSASPWDVKFSVYSSSLTSRTIDTSTDSTPLSYNHQRKEFYDGTQFWAFYYDGSNTVYTYSADGQTWENTVSSAFATAGADNPSVWYYDSGTTKIVYIVGDTGANDGSVIVRRGTISGSAITWGTEATASTSNFNLVTKVAFIARDTSNYLWIVSNAADTGGLNNVGVVRSTNTDDVAAWGSVTYLLTAAIAGSQVYPTILPLSGGNMYALWYADGTIAGRLYSGTWGAVESIATTTAGVSTKIPSAVVDGSGTIHLVYVDSAEGVQYVQRTTSWGSPTALTPTQFARPSSDVDTGTWTPTPIWQSIDDNSDTDYVTAGAPGVDEVHLSSVTDPQSSLGHIIRFRARATGSGQPERMTVVLYQGSTSIASTANQQVITEGSFNTYTYTLTASQADSITDYTDLRLRLSADVVEPGESIDCAWAELEVPPVGPNKSPTVTRDTSTGDLYVFWIGTGNQIQGKKFSGSWSSVAGIDTSSIAKGFITSPYTVPSALSVSAMWGQGSTSPYEVKIFKIPEFENVLVPIATVVGLGFLVRRRRRRHTHQDSSEEPV